MHICTVCDNNYIHKGLTLYQSLTNTGDSFTLHWLCCDDLIYSRLESLSLPGIVVYKLSDLEDRDPELRKAKNNPKSSYGNAHSQYIWTLTPWFINYLFRKDIAPLLYADADIYFYQSPVIIAQTVGNKSVGIHTHRFTPPYRDDVESGWYNVGVLYFHNTGIALNISECWKKWLLDGPAGPYYATHGGCGDQKFLELFMPFFGRENICVFDQEGAICHQAPWCIESCNSLPVLFYHFSHFTFDLEKNTWADHLEDPPEWLPTADLQIRLLYQNYYKAIKESDRLLSVGDMSAVLESDPATAVQKQADTFPDTSWKPLDIIGNVKIDESKPERVKMLLACIRSFAFLKDHCRFLLLLEGASSKLLTRVRKEMNAAGFDYMLFGQGFGDYGKSYRVMLKASTAPYILNFLEDHFCTVDDPRYLVKMIGIMKKLEVDLMKTSFHQVELKSMQGVDLFYQDPWALVYDNTIVNHKAYEKFYKQRYFVSVHFLATREFVTRFFSRALGDRPHEYELTHFTPGWEHRVLVPHEGHEFIASIDDDHGEERSNLQARPEETKFWETYNSL